MPFVDTFGFGVRIPGGVIAAAILALALVTLVVLGVRRAWRDPRPRRRVALGGLRAATACVAWLVAVQPVRLEEKLERSPGRVVVLADVSRSMTVRAGERTRAELERALLERWSSSRTGRRAAAYAFGGAPRPATLGVLARGIDPREDDTRIVDSIRAAVDGDEHGDVGAIVVVSDGADRVRDPDVESLARLGVRVHTVAVGADDTLRDDAIARVDADARGFLRQTAKVRVTIRVLGGEGGAIPVTLYRGEQLVREATVEVGATGEASVDIPFTPDELGRAVYRLTIPTAPDDAVPENNERAFLVKVARDRLRVLLLCGRPSWDERYLRAFLKRDPTVDLISFFILRTASDLTMSSPDELALIPFPTDELFSEHLPSFDLLVLQNFDYGPYHMAQYLPRIRDYVREGGSLAMVGGDLAFASGRYAETPVGAALPVTIPPSSVPETEALVLGRFAPALASEGSRHPIVGLADAPAANAAAWAALAPLEGANRITGLAQNGRALLVHPTERDARGAPMPVLAVGTFGGGRTLALASDTSWRWGIATGGATGDASAYERFWDRAIRWLTRDPELEPASVTTDRERYGPAARIRASAILRDDRYEPIADRDVRVALLDGAGSEVTGRSVRTAGDGRVTAELAGPSRPGGYRVVVRGGSGALLAEEWLVVEAGGDELADPRARPELLERIARATGGTFARSPSAAASLDSIDATRTRSLGTTEHAPFATVWAFALLAGLFAIEWVSRRAWGHR